MKVKPRKAAETREVAVAPIYSKYSSYPSNGLTPQRLAAIFREADEGEVYRQMELFQEMEEKDPHLFSQLQTRKNAVTGLDWEVIPYSDDPTDKAVAEFVGNQLRSIKNLEDALFDLLDAIGKGIAISEIMWGFDGERTVVQQIKPIHQKLLRWDMDDTMRIVTNDSPMGIPVPENKLIIHKYKAKSGHPSRAGILRVVAWMYLFKNYDIKDWIAFVEVFGLPLRLGKYAAGASEDDKQALWEALVKMGTDAAGMVPDGCAIDFVTSDGSKGSANGIYETLARYCDEQVSKAILGQTLTSDSGGSYAQSKTHNDVRHDLTIADCKALAATLRDDLIRPLVLFNFGQETRLPTIVFDCELPEDLKALVSILKDLTGIGIPIPLSYIYKKFSIPQPEQGEPIAQMTANAPVALKQVANKTSADYQQHVDDLAEQAIDLSEPIFAKMVDPLQRMTANATSLEELQNKLQDDDYVRQLFDSTISSDLQALLADAMLAADLLGRMREHG